MAVSSSEVEIRKSKIATRNLQLPLILLLALALRLAFLFLAGVNAPLTGDEVQYHQIASNLAAGRGFVQNDNPFFPGQELYAWQAPLYPLVLGLIYRLFGAHALAGKLFGILLGVATVYAVHDLARRMWVEDSRKEGRGPGTSAGGQKDLHSTWGAAIRARAKWKEIRLSAASWAALVVAIYPGFLTGAHLLLSETLFIFLLVLAFDLIAAALGARPEADQRGYTLLLWLLAGATWGLVTLTRGVTLYFVVPFAVWLFLVRARRALTAAVIFALAAVAVISPWTIRNWTVFHQFVPLETKGGVNFWLGNSPYTPDDFIRNVWKVGVRDPMLAALPRDEVARDRAGYSLGLAYVQSQPFTFLVRMPVKLADFWGFERNLVDAAEATRDNKAGGWTSPAKIGADLVSAGGLVVLVLLAIGGFVFSPDDRWKSLVGLFIAYYVAAHLVVFGDGRFHLPLVALLALYAGWLLARGRDVPCRSRERVAAASILTVVFLTVWGHEILAAARTLLE